MVWRESKRSTCGRAWFELSIKEGEKLLIQNDACSKFFISKSREI